MRNLEHSCDLGSNLLINFMSLSYQLEFSISFVDINLSELGTDATHSFTECSASHTCSLSISPISSSLSPPFHFAYKTSFLVQIKFITEDSEQTHIQILILN